ncbi:hypothetical protein D9M68_796480 [compost metagenome]
MRFSWAAALALWVLKYSGTNTVLLVSTRTSRLLSPGGRVTGNQKLRTCTGRWMKG